VIEVDPNVVSVVSAMDRDVFAAHPELRSFVRPMALGELPCCERDAPALVVRVDRLPRIGRVRRCERGQLTPGERRRFAREVTRRLARALTPSGAS
jgi:hypothetical protein